MDDEQRDGATRAPEQEYPGQHLGMPEHGPGSVGRFGRRLVAIAIDWGLCQLIAYGLFGVTWDSHGGREFIPLAIFAVENLLLVSTAGSTVGHRLVGLRVSRPDGRVPGFTAGAIRTALLCLVIPALVWDRDSRGLHDKAAGTAIIRTR